MSDERRDENVHPDPDPERTQRWSSDDADETRDWSHDELHDVHDAARAARDAARAAREQMREAAREAREQVRQAEREARRLAREERRSHRIRVSGHGMNIDGVDVDDVVVPDFAKGFMRGFMRDVGGDSYNEVVRGEFLFERMPRLRVRNISGATTIRTGEPGKITVVATKRVSAGSEERAKRLLQNLEIRMEKQEDELRVEPHLYEQERSWVDLFRGKRFRVDFEITVPQECAVDAQTVSGEISVSGVSGPHDVQAVSGDVSIVDAAGPLRLKSVSGDVDVRRYVGHVEGNTVSGDVTFDAVRIRSLSLQTVSGDVSVNGVLEAARPHRIKTISGDIGLALAEADLVVEFHTTSGDLEADAAARVTRMSRKQFSAVLGEGRGQAVMKTVSGDLEIRSAAVSVPGEPSPEAPRAGSEAPRVPEAGPSVEDTLPMAPPPPREDVRDLLERLARGELGVDDVAAALDEARKRP